MGVIFKKDQPDKTADLQKEVESLKRSVARKDKAIKEMQEKNEVLEQQLNDTQLALCEIYESLEV